jgi:hypothetical protein
MQRTLGVAKGLYNTVAHPLDTVGAIADVAYGSTVGKLANVPEQQTADQFWNALKERYGGASNISETMRNDPVGLIADLSALATGTGAGLKVASVFPKMGALNTVADVALSAGNKLDPVRMAGSGVGFVAGKATNPLADLLGASTGTGAEAI